MRTHLWQSLVSAAMYNYARQETNLMLFECGQSFSLLDNGHIQEPLQVSAIMMGEHPAGYLDQKRDIDYYDIQLACHEFLKRLGYTEVHFTQINCSALHPGQSARVLVQGVNVGMVGMVHPQIAATLNMPDFALMHIDIDHLPILEPKAVRIPSKYPSVTRDLTVSVPSNVEIQSIVHMLQQADISHLKSIRVIDSYTNGESEERQVTFSVIYQSVHRTLKDKQIDQSHQSVSRLIHNFLNE